MKDSVNYALLTRNILDAPAMRKSSNKLIKLRSVTVLTNASQHLSTFLRKYRVVNYFEIRRRILIGNKLLLYVKHWFA